MLLPMLLVYTHCFVPQCNADSLVCDRFDPCCFTPQLMALIQTRFPTLPFSVADAVVQLSSELASAAAASFRDDPATMAALTLSVRQSLRLARHASSVKAASARSAEVSLNHSIVLAESLKEILLLQFLPETARSTVQRIIDSSLPLASSGVSGDSPSRAVGVPVVADGVLRIGSIEHTVSSPINAELVPNPLFYNIPRYVCDCAMVGERKL